eukprot:TRINITY_DN650_c2_g4_i1.p1 TRINITY_DN650_c2_g4~~TRINITY_DN650_c2_g4_i1.p1  ORF type:complete len:149 (+),score=9.48 TRINITY_DN650_c2_g4_i1:762-1208(+)
MNIFESTKFLLTCAVALVAVYVALGAPVLSLQFETLAAGVWGSLVLGLPLCYANLGTFGDVKRIAIDGRCSRSVERSLMIYARVVVFMAWASAAFIPLDWDVWYQRWPVPLFLSTMVSVPVGVVLALIPFPAIGPPPKEKDWITSQLT